MALFKKKEKKGGVKMQKMEEIPRLPELPQLPELPDFSDLEEKSEEPMTQLPSLPSNSLGNKFSQNIIKEAVSGKKENMGIGADDFAEELQPMQRPMIREVPERESFSYPSYPKTEKQMVRESEPLFIRIDRFEEGSQTFDEVKKQISEIEKMFGDVKKIKEKEENEIKMWEDEIKQIKEKIEKIDSDIFSKLD
ncbi:Uncharacterised protein [uncultured archaeon]|nr:Uncharacterised protein [uncultured archaeon]